MSVSLLLVYIGISKALISFVPAELIITSDSLPLHRRYRHSPQVLEGCSVTGTDVTQIAFSLLR